MKRIVDHSSFFIIEFVCITLAVILWRIFPGLSWKPLIIAIASIVLRITAGRSPLVRTPFDLPIVVFLLTIGVGIWAAYQPAVAWAKFWFLIAAILFYYLLARQPADNLWTAAIILSLLGFGISIYFFLSNNWEVQPVKVQLLSQIGIAWMRIRPNLPLESIHPNDIAGIAVIALPFSLALTLRYAQRKSYLWSFLFGLIVSLILATILMSVSRGAWVAVGATAGLCILWWAITSWLNRRRMLYQQALFIASLGLLVCLAAGYIWISVDHRLSQVALGTADVIVSDSRFHIFWSAIELIKDVPFTGGGLDGFPGLYSRYIMLNPNYILGYSHNIFLDASLQQGILAGLMLFWIYLGNISRLALKPLPSAHSYLRIAVLSSLLIIIFHGLVDNIVLRTMFTMLLFFVPGMAVGLVASTNPEPVRKWRLLAPTRRLAIPVMIALGLIIIGSITFRRPLLSAWYTNLGAVEMAKVELADFPTSIWDDGKHAELLSPAEAQFNRALAYDPVNPGAHYRLGLIAMLKRDFSTAVNHLEIAHRGDPYHRGMIKALGLSYVWNGQIDAALPLLSLISESNQELTNYQWWWGELDRPDLAAYAEHYIELVGSGQ